MPEPARPTLEELERECRAFTRYLARVEPTTYIADSYLRGHAGIPYLTEGRSDTLDQLLLRIARAGQPATQLADLYARFFRPTGILRQKLILLCAVLENSPGTHVWFNSASSGGRLRILTQLALAGAGTALSLVAAALLLGPLHLALTLFRGRTTPEAAP